MNAPHQARKGRPFYPRKRASEQKRFGKGNVAASGKLPHGDAVKASEKAAPAHGFEATAAGHRADHKPTELWLPSNQILLKKKSRLPGITMIDLTVRNEDSHVAGGNKDRLALPVGRFAVLLTRQFRFEDVAGVAALHFQTNDGAKRRYVVNDGLDRRSPVARPGYV